MKVKVAVSLLLFFSVNTFAQHQDVFPGLTGQELLDSLVANFKSTIPLDQADGRDTLFGIIDNHNDSLTCVYTGYTIYLNPNQDPTEAAFMDDGPNAINTEHTYPQSLGASGIAKGDLHHLYPTRKDVNADRSNSPFGEIPDAQTESWYYLDQETSSIPSSNIDKYSERLGDLFEPPEAHKGNVARSMMYFYTMYKEQADMANSSYFELQRQTFCEWHFLDPVDGAEWSRTWGIAQYQEWKPNPYVLDCTLPERTFCQDFGQQCTPVSTSEATDNQYFTIEKILPNPMEGGTTLQYSLGKPCSVRLEVFNLQGSNIDTVELGQQSAGSHQYFWKKNENITAGIIIARMIFTVDEAEFSVSKKIVVK